MKSSVLEQFLVELAQLMGKEIVDKASGGAKDEGPSVQTADKGDSNDAVDSKGSGQGDADDKDELKAGQEVELDNLKKPKLLKLAKKVGLSVDAKWDEAKLREELAKKLQVVEATPEAAAAPATEALAEETKDADDTKGMPRVGQTILIKENDGSWVDYKVVKISGTKIFTKKWQVTADELGKEWKHK